MSKILCAKSETATSGYEGTSLPKLSRFRPMTAS
jgi:hypothetical protein